MIVGRADGNTRSMLNVGRECYLPVRDRDLAGIHPLD
jgi:hypothetical protein